jgi:hypothetical protein
LLTYNKKVIKFPSSPVVWSFWDFVLGNNNLIEDWYNNELSEEGQYLFDSLLKGIYKTDQPINWVGLRRFLKGKLQEERIWELEFRADKRQYRVLGKFGAARKQAILLIGCYHKGSVYTPADALDQALKRSRMLDQGKATTSERTIKEDI